MKYTLCVRTTDLPGPSVRFEVGLCAFCGEKVWVDREVAGKRIPVCLRCAALVCATPDVYPAIKRRLLEAGFTEAEVEGTRRR